MNRPLLPPTGLVKGPIRIGKAYRRTVNSIVAGLWATGALWLVYHYLLRQPGEFGPETHSLEPWWLRLHGAFAFGTLWSIGLLSASHLLNGWASRRRRWSGSTLLATAIVLSLSGYLLYYAGDEGLRAVTSVLHWGLGLAAPLAFAWHRYLSARGNGLLNALKVQAKARPSEGQP